MTDPKELVMSAHDAAYLATRAIENFTDTVRLAEVRVVRNHLRTALGQIARLESMMAGNEAPRVGE